MRRAPEDKQRDAERTKARIVQAAVEEFGAKGYAGARVNEIAQRAGVNKQLISYYFGGKEGLYHHVVAQWRGQESSFTRESRTLAQFVAAYARANAANRDFGKLLVWSGLSDAPPDPAFAQGMREAVADLRRRQEAGEFPDDLDPAAVMVAFFSMAAASVAFPQLVSAVSDLSPEEFGEHYAEELEKLVGRLGTWTSM